MNLSWNCQWQRKGCGTLQEREKILQDRGALPREEGDVIREYSAMHEENFLRRIWLVRWKEERRTRTSETCREKKGKRGGGEKRSEKEENEMVSVERRCVDCISAEAFGIFSRRGFGELWCFLE